MVKHIDKVARAYNAEKYYFKSKRKIAKLLAWKLAANINNEVNECNEQYYVQNEMMLQIKFNQSFQKQHFRWKHQLIDKVNQASRSFISRNYFCVIQRYSVSLSNYLFRNNTF